MSHSFKVAIIGAGRIAGLHDSPSCDGAIHSHAQAYNRDGRFRLDAVVEPDGERRERFARTWKVRGAYASIEELLDRSAPDVVSICSSTKEHYAQLSKVISSRDIRAVLCEKPVCERPAELADIVDSCDVRPDLLVLINHSRRFDPVHGRVASEIRAGEFGSLVGGRCDYYGGWRHNGSHLVDTIRMLVGEIDVIEAAPSSPGKPGDPCLDVRLAAGAATIDLFGFDEDHYQLFEIDLRFTKGRVAARNFGEEIVVEKVAVNAINERYLRPSSGSPFIGLQDPLKHAVDNMAQHLEGRRSVPDVGAMLSEAAQTMRIIWKAEELAH